MLKRFIAILISLSVLASGAVASANALAILSDPAVRETPARGEAVETHLPSDQSFKPWTVDPSIFDQDQGDRIEKRKVAEKEVKTIKLDNLVPPILFPLGKAEIPDNYVERLQRVLDSMRDRTNVRLHFVGHTDNLALRGDLVKQYGDNVGLSRERAGTTAEYFQNALGLPPEAISYEGVGDSQPIASNATPEGRARNRRVEVEVWYDEVSEKMVDKEVVVPREVNRIKVCRTETVCKLRYKEGHSHRACVKNLIAPLHYEGAMVTVPDEYLDKIRQ
ncbi:MAG: OmpA family protein, partial [Gammaproteobacteria bacterium]